MKFKNITYAKYKEIAETFLTEHPFGIEQLPTDIELLIEKAGIHIIAEDNLKNNFEIKGFVAIDIKGKGPLKIIIDAEHYEKDEFQYKFTLAEELAHILAHKKDFENITNINEFIKCRNEITEEDYIKIEQQARNIASYLLLPQNKFKNYVFKWIDENINEFLHINFESPENFVNLISRPISRELKLSQDVIRFTIATRYPDRIIDEIVEKYGKKLMI